LNKNDIDYLVNNLINIRVGKINNDNYL